MWQAPVSPSVPPEAGHSAPVAAPPHLPAPWTRLPHGLPGGGNTIANVGVCAGSFPHRCWTVDSICHQLICSCLYTNMLLSTKFCYRSALHTCCQGGIGETWRLAQQTSLLVKELLERLGVTVVDWSVLDGAGTTNCYHNISLSYTFKFSQEVLCPWKSRILIA